MTKTDRAAYRHTPETTRQIEDLIERWRHPITGQRLGRSDVVDECIKRVHEQETKKEGKRRP